MDEAQREYRTEQKQSPEQEETARRLLIQALGRLDQWDEVVSGLKVQPRTALAGDDAATPYETLSSQVTTMLAVGVDHMRTLREVAIKAQTLPWMASFTLIRSAFESTGTALWLLGPASRDTRVIRSLQLASEAHRDVRRTKAEIRGERFDEKEETKVTRRLKALRDARPGLGGRTLDPPTMTKRLGAAQEFAGDIDVTVLALWRIASGAAHGRRAVLYELLDRELVETDENGFMVAMTTSFTAIAGFYVLAERYLNRAIVLFNERNQPRPE